MKNKKSLPSLAKYSALSVIALSSPMTLSAIERPTPAAQPEEKVAQAAEVAPANEAQPALPNPIPMPEANAQKVAFLGVFGEPVADILSAHLNLEGGIGLQLELVADDSPASKAGLKKHDIITSLANKDISSQDDLRAAISDKKPGDTIELQYISKGKAMTKDLTLGARPNMRQAEGNGEAYALPIPKLSQKPLPEQFGHLSLPKEFLDKFPKEDREKLMKLFKGNLKGLDLQELQNGLGKLEGFDLNLRPKGLNPKLNKGLKFKAAFQSRVKMIDGEGSITLETAEDGKIIELLDKEGKLQYRGPYNTEADKKSIPQEFRDRVENLGIDKGLGMQINPSMKHLREMPNMNNFKKQFMENLPKELQQQLKNNKNLNMLNIPNLNLKNGNGVQRFEFKLNGNGLSQTPTDPETGYSYNFKRDKKISR